MKVKKTDWENVLDKGDITKLSCDCIVNAANNNLPGEGGGWRDSSCGRKT